MTWKLIFENSGREAPPFPFEAKDFRGHMCEIDGGAPPHKPDSTGFVYADNGRCYPNVFGLKWIKEEDHG